MVGSQAETSGVYWGNVQKTVPIDMSNGVLDPALRARSFGDLFERLKEAHRRLSGKSEPSEGTELWYRGSPKLRYTLKPSLFRFPHGKASEAAIYKQFLEHGAPRERDWPTLFEMQHHFIPTRLLDWTTSVGVALHFALNSDDPLDNPVIWILHPGMLNRRALPKKEQAQLFPQGTIQPLTIEDLRALGLEYHDAFITASLRMPDLPLGITAEAAFDRLRAQRGRFTVHGKSDGALEDQCPECVQRIIISNLAIEEIRDGISLTGFDALSIFPDRVGLADFLRRRHGLTAVGLTKVLVKQLSELWESDRIKLEQGVPTSISGIENCAIGDRYITRNNIGPAIEFKVRDWVQRDEGGICIVTGVAGSGKTNCLLNMVVGDRLYEKRTVIWYPLFRFDPREGFVRNVQEFLESILDRPAFNFGHALEELCRKSDTVIVLDGLDELSRIKGRECAAALAESLKRELRLARKGSPDAPKVLMSCRRDIFDTLKPELGLPDADVLEPIEPLSTDAIKENFRSKPLNGDLLKFLAQYPVFLKFLRDSPLPDPMPVNPSGLFEALMWMSGDDPRETLRTLGKIAKEMLERRQDYLSPKVFAEVIGGMRYRHFFGPDSMQVLLEERNSKDVRFLHHTIREFVLAWNIHDSLTGRSDTTGGWDLLMRQSDLDYEGAEVHRAVAELGGVPDWAAVRGKWTAIGDQTQKNNFAWCAFETAGMLGTHGEQRRLVLDWIREVLSGSLDGKDYRCSFKVKHNALRCLERLHPNAPASYWEWVVDLWRKRAIPSELGHVVDAYAVRGFQRSQLDVNLGPFFIVGPLRGATLDPDQESFSKLLLDCLHDLASYAELSRRQFRVLINLTYALIRWYSPLHLSSGESLLHGTPSLDPLAEANLRLALWLWHPDREDSMIRVVNRRVMFIADQVAPLLIEYGL